MTRSNLTLHDMINKVLSKFIDVQVLTDDGLLKDVGIDQKYEDTLFEVEKQYKKLIASLKRLDKVETIEAFNKESDVFLDIIEFDIPKATMEWATAYIDALRTAVWED